MITRDLDGFYLKTEEAVKLKQTTIFDGIGIGLGENKDNLTYNIREKGIKNHQRIEQIVGAIENNLASCIIWVDFTNPEKNLKTISNQKELSLYGEKLGKQSYNLGENDNVIIFEAPKLVKELEIKSLALAGAVADCAGICGSYEKGEIISITHAGWQGVVNGVIEQLIYTYMAELGRKEFKKVKFDFSPMAGVNYEWERKFFDLVYLKEKSEKLKKEIESLREEIVKLNYLLNNHLLHRFFPEIESFSASPVILNKNIKKYNQLKKEQNMINLFLNLYELYNIDPIKEKIAEATQNPQKIVFFLDRIIKRIFLENGASLKQLNFHKDYTTDIQNTWPSYRIHSLWKNGIINASWTKKSENGIIHDKRIGIFNILKI